MPHVTTPTLAVSDPGRARPRLWSGLAVAVVSVLGLAVAVAWLSPWRGRPQVLVRFIGYTNVSYGAHVGVIQVSNASPFAVVRGRSPRIESDSPATPSSHAPTGWNVLQPQECEQVQTEPITGRARWKLTVACERLGGDSYGIGVPDLRARVRQLAVWLRDHRVPVSVPSPRPTVQFSSDWIDP
jgi:hypothetical protein